MTGKKILDMILLLLMIVTTLAVIGLFYYIENVYKRPPINEDKEKKEFFSDSVAKTIPTLVPIPKTVISLIPSAPLPNLRLKYLEVELSLVLFESSDTGVIKTYEYVVLHNMIKIASEMGAMELNTLTGKMLFENRLKNEINKSLKKEINKEHTKPIVKGIFFSSYIVQ